MLTRKKIINFIITVFCVAVFFAIVHPLLVGLGRFNRNIDRYEYIEENTYKLQDQIQDLEYFIKVEMKGKDARIKELEDFLEVYSLEFKDPAIRFQIKKLLSGTK